MSHDTSTIRTLVATVLDRLGGNDQAFPGGLVTDDALIMGPGGDDIAHVSPERRDRRLGSAWSIGAPPAPEAVRVGLAAGRRSGWFWAVVGEPTGGGSLVERTSGVVSLRSGRWMIDHLYTSHGLANEDVPRYAAEPPEPAGIGDDIPPGTEKLVELFRRNMLSGRFELITRRDNTVVIGTDPLEIFEGGSAYLDAMEPMRELARQLEATSRFDFPGGTWARLTNDGMTGLVATHVVATMNGMPMPTFRASWVFTRVDGDFRLVCDHHGFPVQFPRRGR